MQTVIWIFNMMTSRAVLIILIITMMTATSFTMPGSLWCSQPQGVLDSTWSVTTPSSRAFPPQVFGKKPCAFLSDSRHQAEAGHDTVQACDAMTVAGIVSQPQITMEQGALSFLSCSYNANDSAIRWNLGHIALCPFDFFNKTAWDDHHLQCYTITY